MISKVDNFIRSISNDIVRGFFDHGYMDNGLNVLRTGSVSFHHDINENPPLTSVYDVIGNDRMIWERGDISSYGFVNISSKAFSNTIPEKDMVYVVSGDDGYGGKVFIRKGDIDMVGDLGKEILKAYAIMMAVNRVDKNITSFDIYVDHLIIRKEESSIVRSISNCNFYMIPVPQVVVSFDGKSDGNEKYIMPSLDIWNYKPYSF